MSTEKAEQTERWQGNRRIDGLSVVEGLDNQWMILTAEGGATMAICPLCEKPFRSAKTARLAADLVYPVSRGDR